jgi:hypothetical protein
VCHLAGRLVRALKGQISNSEIKITKEDELCVKIAALCHDLGKCSFLIYIIAAVDGGGSGGAVVVAAA